MHDVLAHTLTGLVVQLDGARLLARSREDDELAEIVQRAHGLARDGLTEARQAISALRGDELPGPERLPALVNEHRRSGDAECRLSISGSPVQLAPDARLAVYRTAQEALNNVRKHAPGARVEVTLEWAPMEAVLTVADTGAPSDPLLDSSGSDYGLAGMAERAQLLGGQLEAGHATEGYRVRLRLPLQRELAS
jgi:signal transduction histidine kinase